MHLQRPKGGGNGEDTTGESLPKQVTAKLSGFNEGKFLLWQNWSRSDSFVLLQKIEVPPEVWNDGVVEVERGEKGHQTRHPPQTVVVPRAPSLRKHDWCFSHFIRFFFLPWLVMVVTKARIFCVPRYQNYNLTRGWDMKNCRKVAMTSNNNKSTVQVYTLSWSDYFWQCFP